MDDQEQIQDAIVAEYYKPNDSSEVQEEPATASKEYLYKMVPNSTVDHDINCVLGDNSLKKANHIIEENDAIITAIKETELANTNKKEFDKTMILSMVRLDKFDIRSRTLNRSLASLRERFAAEIPNYYNMLIPFIKRYCSEYKEASAVIQADKNDCFYRVVVSIPNATMEFKKFCVPVYFIDATFYQSCHYDGVIISLSAKNANGGILYLSSAWVTCENMDNYLFFLLTMRNMGFDITNIPFMSDRGHFLSAVKYLESHNITVVSVKFFIEHIIRNVNHRFYIEKNNTVEIRNAIMGLQSATTYKNFQNMTHKILQFDFINGW